MRFILVRRSENKKTGKIAVSMSPKQTCPKSCIQLILGVCYAGLGPSNSTWNKLSQSKVGMSIDNFFNKVQKLPKKYMFRHNSHGDLISPDFLKQLSTKAAHLIGWTYTHHKTWAEMLFEIKKVNQVVSNNKLGLAVNLSCDYPAELDKYKNSGIPLTTTLPTKSKKVNYSPGGMKIITCPADYTKITCKTCGAGNPLCFRVDRNYAIGFPAHGVRARKLSEWIENKMKLNVLAA